MSSVATRVLASAVDECVEDAEGLETQPWSLCPGQSAAESTTLVQCSSTPLSGPVGASSPSCKLHDSVTQIASWACSGLHLLTYVHLHNSLIDLVCLYLLWILHIVVGI